jgi:hypothetical protein
MENILLFLGANNGGAVPKMGAFPRNATIPGQMAMATKILIVVITVIIRSNT